MSNVLTSLLPIFALILMGFILRHKNLLAREFWLPFEQLNCFYLFPVLMFSQVARADLGQFRVLPIAAAVLGAVLAGALLLFGWKAWRGQSGALFASVIQGELRPNTYVGVAASLHVGAGLAITSICIAVAIALLNVASIVVLMRYGGGPAAPDARQIGRALVRNPVIVSVLMGSPSTWPGCACRRRSTACFRSSAALRCRSDCWPLAPAWICRRPVRPMARCCRPPSSSCCWCRW